MALFENNFLEVHFDASNKIVSGIWKNVNMGFTDTDFRNCMLAWFEEVKKIKDVNVLADARHFDFIIEPATQVWVNENIIGLYPDFGVAKLAFLVSADIFSQISIEQTIEEVEQAFEVRYFEDEEQMISWLTRE